MEKIGLFISRDTWFTVQVITIVSYGFAFFEKRDKFLKINGYKMTTA